MVFFHATGGRLGNQLFQTAVIERRRRPRELVVTTQMPESRVFLGRLRRYRDFSNPFLVNLVDHAVSRFIVWPLINLRLISSVVQDGGNGVRETRGVLPITYFRGYFQAPKYFQPTCISKDWIRRSFRDSALHRIHDAEGRLPLFIHVRRSDYGNYRADGRSSALLPLSYYRSAVSILRGSVRDPHFFLLGDDPSWCEEQFAELPHKTISRGSSYEDLALMSLCAGGVTSNSSFAWWGAFLCARTAPIIAPRYWFGWRKKEWLPQGIEESDFQFIEVVDEERKNL